MSAPQPGYCDVASCGNHALPNDIVCAAHRVVPTDGLDGDTLDLLERFHVAAHQCADRDTGEAGCRTAYAALRSAIEQVERENASAIRVAKAEHERAEIAESETKRLHSQLSAQAGETERLMAALREIVKARGAFGRDPLTFAKNTIEAMRKCALAALDATEEGKP